MARWGSPCEIPQGTRLPIAETVPFRLTQNVVDGLGMTGVDGVFRRSSEEIVRVLREGGRLLMTVLEVFKHDPLQQWYVPMSFPHERLLSSSVIRNRAISADIAKQLQGSEDEDGTALTELPDDADRALGVVKAKLESKLSVEYTVNDLIQQAMDHENLARIFCGSCLASLTRPGRFDADQVPRDATGWQAYL